MKIKYKKERTRKTYIGMTLNSNCETKWLEKKTQYCKMSTKTT